MFKSYQQLYKSMAHTALKELEMTNSVKCPLYAAEICKVLRKWGLPAIPLTDFDPANPPTTWAEARKCIKGGTHPGRGSLKATWIYLATALDDVIFIAYEDGKSRMSGGLKKNILAEVMAQFKEKALSIAGADGACSELIKGAKSLEMDRDARLMMVGMLLRSLPPKKT